MTFEYQVTHIHQSNRQQMHLTVMSLLAYPVTLFFFDSTLLGGIYPLVFRSVFWGAGGAPRHRNR